MAHYPFDPVINDVLVRAERENLSAVVAQHASARRFAASTERPAGGYDFAVMARGGAGYRWSVAPGFEGMWRAFLVGRRFDGLEDTTTEVVIAGAAATTYFSFGGAAVAVPGPPLPHGLDSCRDVPSALTHIRFTRHPEATPVHIKEDLEVGV